MAKLLKLRRGTTTQHGSFTGAEGELTIDITKDTAVVHDGSQAGGRPLAREDMSNVSSASIAGQIGANAIDGSKISDGTITNAEVNASAAIAGTKINPYFGSQDISTTGHIDFPNDSSIKLGDSDEFVIKHTAAGVSEISSSADVTISSNLNCSAGIDVTGAITSTGLVTISNATPTIRLADTNPSNQAAYDIKNTNSTLRITDSTNSADRLVISGSGELNVSGNANFSSGVDVTGNITVTGTVDGVDISSFHAATSALSSGSATLTNGVLATTQSQGDDSQKVATTAYVDLAAANVIHSAPGALDTLNELAAALGDDANFSTTVTNSIATKLPLAGGQMTGNITMAGSQTVDGRDLSADGTKLDTIESGATADQSNSEIAAALSDQRPSMKGATFTDDGTSSPVVEIKTDDNSPWGFRLGNDSYWDNAGNGYKIYQDNNGAVSTLVEGNGEFVNWYLQTVNTGTTNTFIHMDTNRAVHLNYQNNNKLSTTSSGVSVIGSMTASGNVTAYSDARLKTDISTINDALGIVGKLRGVSYKWLKDGSDSIGVIAQEVEEVLPEVVVTGEGVNPVTQEIEEIKSVDYGKIVGVLINAINELNTKLESQESYFLSELEKHKSGGH